MADSIMLEKSKELAVDTVLIGKEIIQNQKEYVLTRQLIKSGTSVGANIHESKYAQSTADFISKMQIALKECYESEYWLEIMHKTGYLNENDFQKLITKCREIRRMLIASINTVKSNSSS